METDPIPNQDEAFDADEWDILTPSEQYIELVKASHPNDWLYWLVSERERSWASGH